VWSAAAFLDPEKEAERIRRAVHAVRDARLGTARPVAAGEGTAVARGDVRALPAGASPTPPGRRRAVRQGTESGAVAGVTDDEREPGYDTDNADNDERLRRDVPPHW
jgi:hypothetical protein